MLKLTEEARNHLAKVRHERKRDHARARFVRNPSGHGVSLSFEQSPKDGDKLVYTDGMDILVARAVANRLDRSVIDVGKGIDGKPCLVLKRQPETSPWRAAA